MSPVWWFPSVSIILNLSSALLFAREGNWRGAVYWLAAACLTYVANGAMVGLRQ